MGGWAWACWAEMGAILARDWRESRDCTRGAYSGEEGVEACVGLVVENPARNRRATRLRHSLHAIDRRGSPGSVMAEFFGIFF